jgi:hypothetical protein
VLPAHATTTETTEIVRSRMTKSLSYLHCGGDVTVLHSRKAAVVVRMLPVCSQATLLPVIAVRV